MTYALCAVAAAPVRKEPAHRSEMVNQLLFGEVMEITAQHNEWCQIKSLYDGYEGWLMQHLITEVDEAIATTPLQYVAKDIINPVTLPTEVINAPMGASLTGFDEETRLLWDYEHKFHGTYNKLTLNISTDLLLKLIQPWMGAPYLWGGRTFMGVDCSGFTQVLFKVLGIPLLRDAHQQATQGTEVTSIAHAKTGDLAFFKNEAGKIVHVGIILNGNQIVHASGKVRVDVFTEKGITQAITRQQTHVLDCIRRIL